MKETCYHCLWYKNTKEFVNTLEDIIHKQGAMDNLIIDSANVKTSKQVNNNLHMLCIEDWQSEANYQHQNFAQHCWKFIKHLVQ